MTEIIKKRRQLTLNEKLNFLERIESGKKLSVAAREFGISNSTASGILKEKSKIKMLHEHYKLSPHRKRMRLSLYSDVDEAVYMWFRQMRAKNAPVNGPMLQQKARELAGLLGHNNFEGSSGWLFRFRERHDMSVEAMRGDNGESGITSIGMTDEEIVSSVTHNNSTPPELEYIVSNVDLSDIPHDDTKIISKNDNSLDDNKINQTTDASSRLRSKCNTVQAKLCNSTNSSFNNKNLNHCDEPFISSDCQPLNYCDSTYNVADTPGQSKSTLSHIKLPEAVSLIKNLDCFFQQQTDIPKNIWDSLNTINNFISGDLAEKLKQRKITDYFKQT